MADLEAQCELEGSLGKVDNPGDEAHFENDVGHSQEGEQHDCQLQEDTSTKGGSQSINQQSLSSLH